MNKQTKGIVTVLAVAAVVAGAFVFFNRSKSALSKFISKKTGGPYLVLLTFDEPFLKAWAKALRQNEQTFQYLGKVHVTLTGKVKQ